MRCFRVVRRMLVGLVMVVVAVVAPAGSSGAQVSGSERIVTYGVTLRIEASGTVAVTETIDYDFGSVPHHGIYRTIPVAVRYDKDHDRLIKLDDLRVSASAGTPDDVDVNGRDTKEIRIGDPDVTITGRHKYTITYRTAAR